MMLHEADAGGVGEQLGEERVEQRDDAAEHVGEDRQAELAPQQQGEAVEQAAGDPYREARRRPRSGRPAFASPCVAGYFAV
jgi:hypothetical protein